MEPVAPIASPPDATSDRRHTRRGVILALSAAALVLIALVWHVTAVSAYASSASPTAPTATRLGFAELAQRLEPWDVRFTWRVVTLKALALFEQGKIDPAFRVLDPYSAIVRGDPLFRQVYQDVLAVKWPLDSSKAHVAHGLDPLLNFTPPKK